MSFRFTEGRSWLKVGDSVELREVEYDDSIHWLESSVREVVGMNWKPKNFEEMFEGALERRWTGPSATPAPPASYAEYLNCDPGGYVVSAPWTSSGLKFIARKDEGKTWRRARGRLRSVP